MTPSLTEDGTLPAPAGNVIVVEESDMVDLFGVWDLVMVVSGVAWHLFTVVIFGWIVLRRHHFPPFRTRNLRLLGFMLACGILFWVCQVLTSLTTGRPNLPRAVCVLISPWLAYGLGLDLYMTILAYRLYLLYWLLVLRYPLRQSRRFYLFPILLGVPTALVLVSATASPRLVSTTHYPNPGNCVYSLMYSALCVVDVMIHIIVLLCLNYLCRHIEATYNDYRETTFGSIAFILLTIVAVNVFIWIGIGPPLYGYLFDREEYLAQFCVKLAADGLSCQGCHRRVDGSSSARLSYPPANPLHQHQYQRPTLPPGTGSYGETRPNDDNNSGQEDGRGTPGCSDSRTNGCRGGDDSLVEMAPTSRGITQQPADKNGHIEEWSLAHVAYHDDESNQLADKDYTGTSSAPHPPQHDRVIIE
ncbi:hypothetical protein H4R33_000335 [Dimargaris cristalligena]|uniref:Uncharacterized protein n=1 Tax=Dimargaris cristalligena TaxID=215637 RepID=A0A4Q0A2M3_9FUNG|nr:hypothetical protein H4R33_000335 [Dimargaris cristalligena]RKP39612.1 hypothetical protein BJ085DRAFT_36996 [Dimargaris cristalligena]|eukprot:RKP39612.1 hypothetical protein BJ085DRAFT_36996 [Dimargaris cristalligena]